MLLELWGLPQEGYSGRGRSREELLPPRMWQRTVVQPSKEVRSEVLLISFRAFYLKPRPHTLRGRGYPSRLPKVLRGQLLTSKVRVVTKGKSG